MNINLPPITAEPIFHIGTFPITNAYIDSCLVVVLFLVLGLIIRKKNSIIPRGIQNVMEAALEFMLGYIDQVTHDRKRSLQILPIIGGIFSFILVCNYLELIPGSGSIGRWLLVDGQKQLVPLFRSPDSDLNLTLAMAVFAVLFSHIMGVVSVGIFRYANKFVKLWDIIKSFSRGGLSIMTAVIEFGVGLLEILSEVAKLVSLSFRLFGNVFAGGILLAIIAGLFAYLLPLPFMMLELIVGLIQALVFAMLALTYFVVATAPIHEEHVPAEAEA
ncbi:MAG TPA: F0F1 ATP synthase subunit A [Patescibacteria group bacterium]|nr:F0F1 ATP synthase subunit A [Patescibacteria group bacterium]